MQKMSSLHARPTLCAGRAMLIAACVAAFLACIFAGSHSAGGAALSSRLPATGGVPRPDHVVIVMEENHAYSEIIGNAQAPYMNSLAGQGALFTNSHGVTHPSQPNYLYLFSGSAQGTIGDECPPAGVPFTTPNLGQELIDAGLTFTGYSEDLPAAGSTVCNSGQYYRKHNPWSDFGNIPTSANQPFTAFPTDYTTLPTLSFIIPNQTHDMHDGTIAQADTWLQANVAGYIQWAKVHNSLLVLTWDEDDNGPSNQIPTIFVGNMVAPGQYSEQVNHLNMLRTLEDMFDLSYAGGSSSATPITDVWLSTTTATATSVANTATATSQATSPATVVAGTASATSIASASATPPISPSATATPTECSVQFVDLPNPSTFYGFVACLACKGFVSGYPCGGVGEPCNGSNEPYFRPGYNVTRGQLSKIAANAAGFADAILATTQTYTYVAPGSPFWLYVERLTLHGAITGYTCGSSLAEPCDSMQRAYFRPGQNVSRGQTSKIVDLASGDSMPVPDSRQTYTDVPPTGSGSTFWLYIERLSGQGVMSGYACGSSPAEPCDSSHRAYFRPNAAVTRGQSSKIVANTFYPNCQALSRP